MSLLTVVLGLALAVPAAAEDAGHRAGDSSLFIELFKHLEPHAVAAVWWGADDKALGFVRPYASDASGLPLHGTPDHPVVFHDPAEFKEYYRARLGGGNGFMIYNINTVMWIACGLMLLLFVPMARKAKRLAGEPPKGTAFGLGESFVTYIRDEMVYPIMGKEHGRPVLPFFLTLFFFILFMNILGLVPLGGMGGTATANLAVTAALALIAFAWIHINGIRQHGPIKHWKNFVPHVPIFVLPIIIVVEIVGIVVKPAALMVRLTANMNAGHLLVLALFGMVYFFNHGGVSVPIVGMAIAIYGLELFVALIQAYIFTYLTIVFVGASVTPEH